ncbi:hypothetical protein [Lactobacillus crispatus]|uniref:hypothetical protein n=1 Tax=Lactobacillus crispatus TaxID=47770 RepID=UPI00103886DB|nr:hypothetical protein [Lactobacillus crispatus]
MTEAKDLKRTTVKCHGMFDPKLAINGSKNEVTIKFIADQKTIDLNKLGRILKDGATEIFVSDQTELPTDEEKDSTEEAKGQLSLLKENKA